MTTTPSASDSGLNLDHLEAQRDTFKRALAAADSASLRMVDASNGARLDRLTDAVLAVARRAAPVSAPIAEPVRCKKCGGDGQLHSSTSYGMLKRCDECKGTGIAKQPAPTAAPEQVAPHWYDDLMTYPSPHGTLVRLADVKCRSPQPSEAAPLADLPHAAALLYNALNDAWQGGIFVDEDERQVRAALLAYNHYCSSAAPSLPAADLSAIRKRFKEMGVAPPAAAPALLDAGEMTRLRRLMKALGIDHEKDSDEHLRGFLCTVLGWAASRIEGTLPGPAAAPAAGDERSIADDPGFRAAAVRYAKAKASENADRWACLVDAANAFARSIAHQPAQEQAEPCVICGSEEPRTGTCGSDDPRALCKRSQAAQHEASAERAAEIANVILRLIGECAMDWKAGALGDPDEPFTSDDEELRVLIDLVSKARAASPVVRAQSEESADADRFVVFVESVLEAERGFEHLSARSEAVCEEMMERKPRTIDEVRKAIDAAIRAAQEGGKHENR